MESASRLVGLLRNHLSAQCSGWHWLKATSAVHCTSQLITLVPVTLAERVAVSGEVTGAIPMCFNPLLNPSTHSCSAALPVNL